MRGEPENILSSPSTTSRTQPPEPGESRSRRALRVSTAITRPPSNAPTRRRPGLRGDARGAAGSAADAGCRVGCRRVVGDQLGRAKPRQAAIETRSSATDRAGGRAHVTRALENARGPQAGLDARGPRADPTVGCRHIPHVKQRRVRLFPTLRPAASSLLTPTPNPQVVAVLRCWRTARPTIGAGRRLPVIGRRGVAPEQTTDPGPGA